MYELPHLRRRQELYEKKLAERTFSQLEACGSFGFSESHAASFALIVYASSWIKCWHPDVLCASVLNAQPMRFYAAAQIVRDARDHGVEDRPVCINASRWHSTLEPIDDERLPPGGEKDEVCVLPGIAKVQASLQ